ncbi:MAG TPA: hypothetical protein VFE47_22910 [Tepidisphaeraceae bacterium]|jgi:hypothetical protein|nr:hypothetical protein [Tepidisphaeraceae bacterium]
MTTKSPKLTFPASGIRGALIACIALALCVISHAEPAGDRSYPIKLDFPEKVGMKISLEARTTEKVHTVVTIPGANPVVRDRDSAVTLQGVVETLAVDSKGRPIKRSCTIKDFSKNDGTQILPAGSVVIADATGKPEQGKKYVMAAYTLKDGTLTPEQVTALTLVFNAHTYQDATDDAVYGTDKPQKVGGTWPINRDLTAARLPLPAKPENVTGEFTLSGITKAAGKDCLQIKGSFSCDKFQPKLPPKWNVTATKLEAHMSHLIPIDGSATRPANSIEMHMNVSGNATRPDGTLETMETSATIVRKTSKSLLPGD